MNDLAFNGRGIVCLFYDWEERRWVRCASYLGRGHPAVRDSRIAGRRGGKKETRFMYADDWEKYEAQRLLLEESMSFVTLEDDTAKLLFDYENIKERMKGTSAHVDAWAEELIRRFNGEPK